MNTGATTNPSIEKIFAHCRQLSQRSGAFQTFSETVSERLEGALRLRRLLAEDPETFDALLHEPQMLDRKRSLSRSKLDLACVYACCEAPTVDKRKKCSKFAKVVGAAHEAGIEPSEASAWLKGIRYTDVLTPGGKAKPSSMFAVRFCRGSYPLLAQAIKEGILGSPDSQISRILEAAVHRCERVLDETILSKL